MFLAFHDSSVQIVHKGPSYIYIYIYIYITRALTRQEMVAKLGHPGAQSSLTAIGDVFDGTIIMFHPKWDGLSNGAQKYGALKPEKPSNLDILSGSFTACC